MKKVSQNGKLRVSCDLSRFGIGDWWLCLGAAHPPQSNTKHRRAGFLPLCASPTNLISPLRLAGRSVAAHCLARETGSKDGTSGCSFGLKSAGTVFEDGRGEFSEKDFVSGGQSLTDTGFHQIRTALEGVGHKTCFYDGGKQNGKYSSTVSGGTKNISELQGKFFSPFDCRPRQSSLILQGFFPSAKLHPCIPPNFSCF